jgi:predicted alpha/beta superfamily hydrolase/thioredoxin-like negative regulator of GroEL
LVFFSFGQRLVFAQKDGDDIVIGKYQVIHSHILEEDRLLFVHLPGDYEDTQLAYPALYLLWADIYNYFADAAIITEKLGSTGEIPPVIIIGVANTNRYRDLLPVKTRDRGEGGGSDNFLRFFEEELIPHIDKTYRTKNFRILAGPQAGAIFSLYALITKPGLFQAVLSENPFMNPENAEFLYPRAESFFKQASSLKGFLYVRCEKDERSRDLEYAQGLARLLESETPEGFRFQVEFTEPSGYFIPPLPFREGLRMLFSGHKLPDTFQTNSLKDIISYYEKRSEEYGFEVDIPPHLLTFEGDKLNGRGKTREALEVFEYMLHQNLKSLNALWRLGETYRGMGELEKARDHYKRFLEIRNTDAAMIQRRLDQVEKILASSAAYRVEQEIRKNGIRAGLKKYQAIRSDPKSGLYFEEAEFNALGYRLMGAGKNQEAIEIFRLNVGMNPGSAKAYDTLAEAYMNNGDTRTAVKNYRKSLELNPDNNNAKEMLKKLEKK